MKDSQNFEMVKMLLNYAKKEILTNKSVSIPAQFDIDSMKLVDISEDIGLVSGSWEKKYSRAYTRQYGRKFGNASFLFGLTDGGWCRRIPGNITTVTSGLEWITPNQVKVAKSKNKSTYRQGDMYFVPMRITHHQFQILTSTRHTVVEGSIAGVVVVRHPQHELLCLPVLDKNEHYRAFQARVLSETWTDD